MFNLIFGLVGEELRGLIDKPIIENPRHAYGSYPLYLFLFLQLPHSYSAILLTYAIVLHLICYDSYTYMDVSMSLTASQLPLFSCSSFVYYVLLQKLLSDHIF